MPEKTLSARQARILVEIERFIAEEHYPPSVRDLCAVTRIPSTSLINYYLGQHEDAGLIGRKAGLSRALWLTDAGRVEARRIRAQIEALRKLKRRTFAQGG